MSINLGLDFGTTYTIASVVDRHADGKYMVRPVRINRTHLIDSIALLDNETSNMEYGLDARQDLGEDSISFRGFKMLIGDKSPELRARKKYTSTITPEKVTQDFIKYVINAIKTELNSSEEIIENLVIGVPASWVNKKDTIDCNLILNNLIRESVNTSVKNIEVVSEPTLACAYYADLYKQKTGENYQGKMLLIDYGGGTLDLSLCDVKANGTNSVVTEIETIGEGWNTHGDDLGKAGLAFMEEVTRIVLLENGFTEEEFDKPEFNKAVADVEEQIILKTGKIESFVTTKTDEDLPNIKPEDKPNMKFRYKSKRINIKISHLREAYNRKIKETLENQLASFDAVCSKHGIDTKVKNKNNEQVKILLVGGFNAFSMTKETIFEHYKYGKKMDVRFDLLDDNSKNNDTSALERSSESKQCAISFGAALIANSIVGFDRTVPYHLGIMTIDQVTGKPTAKYAIDKYTKADSTIHWAHAKGKKEPAFYTGTSLSLFYNLEDEQKERIFTYSKGLDDFQEQLNLGKYFENGMPYFNIGLSIDKYLTITLHLRCMDSFIKPKKTEEHSIVLDTIDKVVGSTFDIIM